MCPFLYVLNVTTLALVDVGIASQQPDPSLVSFPASPRKKPLFYRLLFIAPSAENKKEEEQQQWRPLPLPSAASPHNMRRRKGKTMKGRREKRRQCGQVGRFRDARRRHNEGNIWSHWLPPLHSGPLRSIDHGKEGRLEGGK